MKRTAFTAIAAGVLIALSTLQPLAAQNSANVVEVDKAVSIALAHNHDYKIALENVRVAAEKVNTAWSQLVPVLSSEASVTRQGAESGFMSLSDGQYDIRLAQLAFGVNPGAFYNSLELSRSNHISARENLRRVRSEIECAVIRSYFDLILAAEEVTLRKESLALLGENLRDVRNLYKTGSVPKFDLLQAQVRHKSVEPLLFDAENRRKVALDLFNYHLGADGAHYTPDRSVLEKRFRAPVDDFSASIDALREKALKNRPEIIRIEMKREMAGRQRDANAALYLWPTFTLAGSYGKTKYMPNPAGISIPTAAGSYSPDFSSISGTDEWQTTWQVRAAATYRWGSLLPADQAKTLAREQEALAREAAEELLKLRKSITISIRSNYSRLHTSYLTIMSQKDNVETAREGLRIARESFRAGMIKNSDLISAEFSLTNAKTAYITAVHDYYVALAELKKEAGTGDIDIIFER